MHPDYLTQHFANRDDFMYYRHAEFSKTGTVPQDIHYRRVLKITEKFNRDERIIARKNIAIREFDIDENEIRLTYHYHPGHYSRATRIYVKPPLAERGERLVVDSQGYNPLDEPEKSLDLFYELDTQLKEEDISMTQVRAAEKEVHAFLETREKEYLTPKLLVSLYDQLRDSDSQIDVLADERARAESQVKEEVVDYLKPYLARMGNPSELPEFKARSLREECLNDYKQLLVRRANKILHEFDEHSQELAKTQAMLTQSEDLSREEEDQILEKMNEINFYLQTLETRLNRHRDLVPMRYKMLMNHLEQNPYFAALD